MKRIDQTFKNLRAEGRAALIPFIVAGDPDLETTEGLVKILAQRGADIIELGVPYSDPLADGPTIQAASQRALQNGVDLKKIFRLTKDWGEKAPPLVLMTYFNPVFRYGLKAFAEDCQRGGIEGVIIPDLPPEEAKPWVQEARRHRVDTIFLASPTTPPHRFKKVSKLSRGFIYYVSITGVTGMRAKLADELESDVRRLKGLSTKPIAVGFGISTPEQAKEVSRFADGVIVGSVIVRMIEQGKTAGREALTRRVADYVSSLAAALR